VLSLDNVADGSVRIDEYVSWLLPLADQFKRVLKPNGSFVPDIGGVWNKGEPTRSLYQYHLLLGLCEKVGFTFAQDFYWEAPGRACSFSECRYEGP